VTVYDRPQSEPAKPPARVPLTIRTIHSADRALWEPLWQGYLSFYEKTIPAEATQLTWTRLTTTGEIQGLLALAEKDQAIGLAQFFFHPSTSSIGGNCYLQDLFVVPTRRGGGVGRKLIEAVVSEAKVRNVAVLYWQTEEFNGPARRLYERVAKRSPFIRYQIDLTSP
jgi:GNAT superfamily N-acetyltransferase